MYLQVNIDCILHKVSILCFVKMIFLAKCLEIKPPKVYNLKEKTIEYFF